jgi:anti-sigma28 factor (negative regulator of flagellin synthesis)
MINGVGNNSPVQKIAATPIHKQLPAQPAKQLRAADKLEVSGVGHMLKALKSNDVRGEMVASVKAQIQAGTYESDAKLNAAVERLLDEMG